MEYFEEIKVLIFKVLMLYHDSVYDEKTNDIKMSDIKIWVHYALAFFGKLGHNLSGVQIWTDQIQIIQATFHS